MHSIKYTGALLVSGLAVWTYSQTLHNVLAPTKKSIISQSPGGRLQLLGNISLAISLLHQVLSVLSILTGLRTINALRDQILKISAPLEILGAILYWPLKYYNVSLVQDRRFALKNLPELERQVHLYPVILEFLSATVFAQQTWRSGILGPLVLFSALTGGYWWWIERTFAQNGFYLYPLFSVLTFEQKAYFIGGSTVVAFVVFKLVQIIQRQFR